MQEIEERKKTHHGIATAERKALFLAAYMRHGTILHAAKEVGVSRERHFQWMKSERYAEAFATAKEAAVECLEREARRRAIEGTKEPVGFWHGKATEYVQKYSDTLLIFLLKAARPDTYRERTEVRHIGNVQINMSLLPPASPNPEEEQASNLVIDVTDDEKSG